MPRVASIEESRIPRRRGRSPSACSATSGRDSSLQFEASEQRMGELVRAFFEGDFLTDFDSVYLLDGNAVRQYKAAIAAAALQHALGQRLRALRLDRRRRLGAEPDELRHRRQPRPLLVGAGLDRGAADAAPGSRSSCAASARISRRPPRASPTTPTSSRSRWRRTSPIIGLTPFGADWKLLVAVENAHGTGSHRAQGRAPRPRTASSAAWRSRSDLRPRASAGSLESRRSRPPVKLGRAIQFFFGLYSDY